MLSVRRMRGISTDDISLGIELTITHRACVYVTVPMRRSITPEMQATMRAVTASAKDLLTRHLPAIPPVHLIHKEGAIMGWTVEWDNFVSWVEKPDEDKVSCLPNVELGVLCEPCTDEQRVALKGMRNRWRSLRDVVASLCPPGGVQSALLTTCQSGKNGEGGKIPKMWCPDARKRIPRYKGVVPTTHAGVDGKHLRAAIETDPLLVVGNCDVSFLWFASKFPTSGKFAYTLILDCDATKEERAKNKLASSNPDLLRTIKSSISDSVVPLQGIVSNSAYGIVVDVCAQYGLPHPEPMLVNVGSGGVHIALPFELDMEDPHCVRDIEELLGRFGYHFGRRNLEACKNLHIDILGTCEPGHGTGFNVKVRDQGMRILRRGADGALHRYPGEHSMVLLKAVLWQARYKLLQSDSRSKRDDASALGPPPSELGAHVLVRCSVPGKSLTGAWSYVKAATLRNAAKFRLMREFHTEADIVEARVALQALCDELGIRGRGSYAVGVQLFQHRQGNQHARSRGIWFDLDIKNMACPNYPGVMRSLATAFIALVREAVSTACPGDFDTQRISAAVGHDDADCVVNKERVGCASATFGMHFLLPFASGYEEILARDGRTIQEALRSLPNRLAEKIFHISFKECFSRRTGASDAQMAVYEYSYRTARGKDGLQTMFDTSTFGSGNKRVSAFLSPYGRDAIRQGADLSKKKCYRCLTPEEAEEFAESEVAMWRSDERDEALRRAEYRAEYTKGPANTGTSGAPASRKRPRPLEMGQDTEGTVPRCRVGSPEEKPEFKLLFGTDFTWGVSRPLDENGEASQLLGVARARLKTECKNRGQFLKGWTTKRALARFVADGAMASDVKVYRLVVGRGMMWKFIFLRLPTKRNGCACQIRDHDEPDKAREKCSIEIRVLCDRAISKDARAPVLEVRSYFKCFSDRCKAIVKKEDNRCREIMAWKTHAFQMRA